VSQQIVRRPGYIEVMMTKVWDDLLRRIQSWPENAQEELAQVALEIEAELKDGKYHATPAELAGIDRGLSEAAQGKFASAQEVEAIFAKHRRIANSVPASD
jgi:predicted transcriptional regulator